jgi:hypothetical protein
MENTYTYTGEGTSAADQVRETQLGCCETCLNVRGSAAGMTHSTYSS